MSMFSLSLQVTEKTHEWPSGNDSKVVSSVKAQQDTTVLFCC